MGTFFFFDKLDVSPGCANMLTLARHFHGAGKEGAADNVFR